MDNNELQTKASKLPLLPYKTVSIEPLECWALALNPVKNKLATVTVKTTDFKYKIEIGFIRYKASCLLKYTMFVGVLSTIGIRTKKCYIINNLDVRTNTKCSKFNSFIRQ